MLLLWSTDFFKIKNFLNIKLSGTLPECQMIWIQIRADILLVLIWVQTVCKDYQSSLARKELTNEAIFYVYNNRTDSQYLVTII